MIPLIRKNWKYLVFISAGAMLGFAYWRFVGCRSGSCPITANWHTSVLFGGLIGVLAVPSRRNKPADNENKEQTIKNEDNER